MSPLPEIIAHSAASTHLDVPDVYFGAEYGAAEQAAGAGEWVMYSTHSGLWQVPLHIRNKDGVTDAASPYGYSGAYCHSSISRAESDRAWESLYDVLRQRGVVSIFLRQSPLLSTTLPHDKARTITKEHPTVLLALQDEEELWMGMAGRSRTSIRKALKLGLRGQVRPVEPKDADLTATGFRALYEETMTRVGASGRYFFPDEYYTTLFSRLASNMLVSEVEDADGRTVASALFMRHGSKLHYHLSGSSPDAARQGATNLLIWQAAQWGLLSGISELHLGGGVERDDSLFRFKRSFGGQLQTFSTYGLIVDPDKFVNAVRSASGSLCSPDENSQFFPPFRKPKA